MPTLRSRPPRARAPWWVLAAVGALLVLASGCQVKVAVDTKVAEDGSGTVTVSVGFDEAALARLREREPDLRLDDLRQAGWEVDAAALTVDVPAPPSSTPGGADGFAWIRATKAFSSPEQLAAVLAEIDAGPDRLFSDVEFQRVETEDDITYHLTGQVDLSKGLATFAEADVAAQLGGDPFGGNVAAIEAAEGKPVSEMVSFEVTTSVAGGPPATLRPALTDTAAQAIDVSTVELKPPSFAARFAVGAAIVVGIVLVILALVGVRRRMAT